MYQVIKRINYILVPLTIFITFYGCILHRAIGPGYTYTISIINNVYPTITDITFLEHLAVNEGFKNRRISFSSSKWECVHYDRDLDEPKYQHLQKYKFLTLGWCYALIQYSTDKEHDIQDFYINIGNNWAGQDPTLKQEIDRLAEVFYKELVNRFGKENVQIEKRRTGPPF